MLLFYPSARGFDYPETNIFVYGDVSSNNDLNQLMFIIRNSGLFVANRDT